MINASFFMFFSTKCNFDGNYLLCLTLRRKAAKSLFYSYLLYEEICDLFCNE